MSDAGSMRLLAVCLGGRAPGCNVELHDVVFAVGTSVEDIHDQLLDRWFGSPDGLHVDAWMVVDQVPGFRVALSHSPGPGEARLYFVNIGGYAPGELFERHVYALYAGRSASEVKARARAELLVGNESVHRDDLYAVDDLVDDLIEVRVDGGWHIELIEDPSAGRAAVTNGYFPLPRKTISAWKARNPEIVRPAR